MQRDVIASYDTHPNLKGQGNTSSRSDYSFVDVDVLPGRTYTYRLSDVDMRGTVTVRDAVTIALDALPEETALLPAWPNPFNPQTKVRYMLAETGPVAITVYDLLGRQVSAHWWMTPSPLAVTASSGTAGTTPANRSPQDRI